MDNRSEIDELAISKSKEQSDDISADNDDGKLVNQENDLNILNTSPEKKRKIIDSDLEVNKSPADGFKKNLDMPETEYAPAPVMDNGSEIDELAISKSKEQSDDISVDNEGSKLVNQENDLNSVNISPKRNRKIIDSDLEVNESSAGGFKKNLNVPETECPQSQSNLHVEDLNKSAKNQDYDQEHDLTVNARRKTFRKIIDSDSEVDESPADGFKKNLNVPETEYAQSQTNFHEDDLNKSGNIEEENQDYGQKNDLTINAQPKTYRKIIDSDSEVDESSANIENLECKDNKNKDETFKTKPKRIAIIDSDSEDETPVTSHNKSFNDDLNATDENTNSAFINSDNKEELVIEDTLKQKSRIAALCDSESSEDERENSVVQERSPPKARPYVKRSKKSGEEPSQKKMSGKEAEQQRNEIRSESQRMLRQSRLSLPYHKPKSHSIKEFLQNRPRLSLLKTDNTPPSLAIKMSTEQLKIVSEKLEERKKEVEKFYKSESESDEENDEIENQKNEETEEPPAENKEEAAEISREGLQLEENKETELLIQTELEIDDGVNKALTLSEDANLSPAHSECPMEIDENNVNVANEQLLLPTTPDKVEQNSCRVEETSTLKGNLPETPTQVSENSEAVERETDVILEGSSDSVEYNFNLDDVEDLSENPVEPKVKNIEEDHLQRLLKKYEAADHPVQPLSDSSKKLSKVELLKQLGCGKPRLSGGPNEEIDLDEGTAKPSAVAQLMERFLQHTTKKAVPRNKIQVDVINLSQGEVRKETVAVSVDPEEDPLVVTEKPGMKLQKLRTELQSQMAQRRSELWQQKQQPVCTGEAKDACDDEKSDCGADEDILDDEEEAELTDGETTDDEEDADGYVEKPEKARVKSAFVEDEAEESDAEESCAEQSDQASVNEDSDDENAMGSNENDDTGIKKPLKRILKGFTEDSDDEDKESDLDQTLPKEINPRSTSAASTDTWEDDEALPPNQPRLDKTPYKHTTPSKPDLGFLSPVIHLTGLQGLNSGSKFLRESPISPFSLPPDPSPLREKNWNTTLQKKLFADSCDVLDSEANMEEIPQMCSGKFAETQPKLDLVDTVTTQDLLSICSGSFSSISTNTENGNRVNDLPSTTDKSDFEFEGVAEKPSSQVIALDLNSVEVKNLDDDRLIFELLDEEEMEQFKKKFESPGALAVSNNSDFDEGTGEVKGGGVLYDSSDEESGQTEMTKKNVKRLHKKLTFSDDESDSDLEEDADSDEEINLCDKVSDEDDVPAPKLVDYDSEENEIEIDDEKGTPQKNLKASDFLENEAELSESDWDSADEDEKGLDALEVEQGDAEVFDENKIRTDLEKIHMRQVLDQDNQEIKILQELLLEDGELHGTGRQRQFRWKNMDETGNDENAQDGADVETYLDEEESEEQWRRARHEREMFLKNKQEKQILLETDDVLLEDSDSQVIKMGQEAVRKSLSATAAPVDKPKKTSAVSHEIKKPLMLMNTRGSFLARNDKFLTRLAEFTRSTTTVVIGGAKKSKNFVFQTVTNDADENINESVNKKRKAVDGTPTFIKKLRLNSDVSPAVNNSRRKKQLFE